MPDLRSPWVNRAGAAAGGLMLGVGIARMILVPSLGSLVWAVLGFLVLGWAVLDRRRFRRGTPESEVDGGHTIE
jgi:hypothetical protein